MTNRYLVVAALFFAFAAPMAQAELTDEAKIFFGKYTQTSKECGVSFTRGARLYVGKGRTEDAIELKYFQDDSKSEEVIEGQRIGPVPGTSPDRKDSYRQVEEGTVEGNHFYYDRTVQQKVAGQWVNFFEEEVELELKKNGQQLVVTNHSYASDKGAESTEPTVCRFKRAE